MFLFPDPPMFTETEVGSPLYLTPLIKSGLIEKARYCINILIISGKN